MELCPCPKPPSAPVLQAAFLYRKVSVPHYEPGSSVNRDSCPVSWLRHAVGGQETRFSALMKLHDLGAVPCTPAASSFVVSFTEGCDVLSPHPGEAANLYCPCFSEKEKGNEGME